MTYSLVPEDKVTQRTTARLNVRNPDDWYRGGANNILYSHTEKPKMFCGEYEWTHIPTGRTGTTKVWCGNFKSLQGLCEAWSTALPEIWKYVPIPKFHNTVVFKA